MNTFRKKLCLALILVLVLLLSSSVFAQDREPRKPLRMGIAVGFGLPRIPLSPFRSPVSILGGGLVNVGITHRIRLQASVYGLHTFNLGRIDAQKGKLRFNLLWVSGEMMYRLLGRSRGASFISAGVGFYELSQQFGSAKEDLTTPGICLGIVQWMGRKKMKNSVEIKWHLLFEPKGALPQVLTATLGFML